MEGRWKRGHTPNDCHHSFLSGEEKNEHQPVWPFFSPQGHLDYPHTVNNYSVHFRDKLLEINSCLCHVVVFVMCACSQRSNDENGNCSGGSMEFPTTNLYELESRVFTDHWSIPYKREESLGKCLIASTCLARHGKTCLMGGWKSPSALYSVLSICVIV